MRLSEMLVVAATVILLVVGVRFAPNQRAERAVGGAFAVCTLIYVAYRIRRVQ